MFHNLLEINNVPPRTSVRKYLYMGTNESEGNMTISLSGGWSEYKPEDVILIKEACEKYLRELTPWECPECFQANMAVPYIPRPDFKPYDWVRCRYCKHKVKREKLGII